ncbi:MAG: hypothetical protein WDZ35_15685 [Crocinitomicaceae bacterium]
MKSIPYLLPLIFTISLLSCGGNSDYEWDDFDDDYVSTATLNIDNGTDTTALVTITPEDKDTVYDFTIMGLEMDRVVLPYGDYHVKAVTVTDSVIVDEDFELSDDDYAYSFNLNLTQEDYIVENIKYVVGSTGDEVLSSSFTYEGKTYDGIDANVIKGKLIVPNQWDYNLDEESPQEVTLYDGQNSTTKKKLYRSSTFILYLELIELFEQYGAEEE